MSDAILVMENGRNKCFLANYCLSFNFTLFSLYDSPNSLTKELCPMYKTSQHKRQGEIDCFK